MGATNFHRTVHGSFEHLEDVFAELPNVDRGIVVALFDAVQRKVALRRFAGQTGSQHLRLPSDYRAPSMRGRLETALSFQSTLWYRIIGVQGLGHLKQPYNLAYKDDAVDLVIGVNVKAPPDITNILAGDRGFREPTQVLSAEIGWHDVDEAAAAINELPDHATRKHELAILGLVVAQMDELNKYSPSA